MRKKRFLAVTLAASMILGNSVVAFAAYPLTPETDPDLASGNAIGNVTMEGTVSEDVFSVELPTVAWSTDVFDFILDPQGLIEKTNGIKYDKNLNTGDSSNISNQITSASDNIAYSTLYFTNYVSDNQATPAPSANKFSNKSDSLRIVNKSAVDVDVALTASVSGMDSVDMVSTNVNISNNARPSVYLALEDSASSNTSGAVIPVVSSAILSSATTSRPIQISGNDSAYKVSFNKTSQKYEYVLSENAEGFKEHSFSLTGACGGGEIPKDWQPVEDAMKNSNPRVEVTWKVTPHSNDREPSIPQGPHTVTAGSDCAISADLGAGELAAGGIKNITFVNNSGVTKTLSASTDYTFSGNTLTFKKVYVDALPTGDRDHTIELDNGDKFTVTLHK